MTFTLIFPILCGYGVTLLAVVGVENGFGRPVADPIVPPPYLMTWGDLGKWVFFLTMGPVMVWVFVAVVIVFTPFLLMGEWIERHQSKKPSTLASKPLPWVKP